MTGRLRWPLLAATIVGLVAALCAVGRADWHQVVQGILSVGIPAFAGLCLLSAATFLLLGASWLVPARGIGANWLGRFAWGRATREAANDLLPFSQLGGIVLGVRTVVAAGAPSVPVYAALIVDLSTEMAAQLVFTLFALMSFSGAIAGSGERLDLLLWGGLGVATALALCFFMFQRAALRLAAVMMRRMLPDLGRLADAVALELQRAYARPGRVAASFGLNLLAWAATAFWSWLALRAMGARPALGHAAALESAIFALRSAAFLIPGAIGVQEAGYALLAPLVGIDPAAALALSLLKRARDVTVGVPVLLAWQAGEVRLARA